ncbi:hypothetical protein AMECASPLE_014332 [Ameca splendens]|uniref:Secreted protein n=1 Tax=Ameca splendens TaxID=208324 RepID=A0ABV0YD30_9TELE
MGSLLVPTLFLWMCPLMCRVHLHPQSTRGQQGLRCEHASSNIGMLTFFYVDVDCRMRGSDPIQSQKACSVLMRKHTANGSELTGKEVERGGRYTAHVKKPGLKPMAMSRTFCSSVRQR